MTTSLAGSHTEPQASTTILLVDQDPVRLTFCSARIQHAGHFVETASGAEEALMKTKLFRPDAIVCDVVMGDIDGFGFCRRVREHASIASIPVILVSDHVHEDSDQALANDVGAAALIKRTRNFTDELSMLKQTIGKRSEVPASVAAAAMYEEHLRANANQLVRLLAKARESKDRYRALFDNAVDIVCLLTREGVVVDINQRWAELFDENEQAFQDLQVRAAEDAGHPERNQPERRIIAIPTSSGSVLQVEFSTSIVDIDGVSLVLAIGRDITAQLETRRALEAAERKQRLTIERIPDILWTRKASGPISITENVLKILGYSAEEVLLGGNAFWTAHTHPHDRAIEATAVEKLLADGTLFDLEYRFQHKDGEWRWLRSHVFSTYEEKGEQHFEGVLTDISARHQMEVNARQAQKMEAIGQLTSGIAHDFNNMLAVVMANAHFAMKGLAADDPKLADMAEISKAADRAAKLTRQMLAFSRTQMLAPKVIDVNAMISELQKMLGRFVREDIVFEVIEGAGLRCVRADVSQLEQVVMNLVLNARDAMPQGGKLTLQTNNETVVNRRWDRQAMPPGEYVVISVADEGIGMDDATMSRIYEPFFTTKGVSEGTGLGLSTCFGIVKQSGGYIWATSELGHGSTFSVYLPCVSGRPSEVRVGRSIAANLRGNETILVVEDDARVRSAIARALQLQGYTVLTAGSSAEALSLATEKARSIDAVLSDVIMPRGNGPFLVTELRSVIPNLRALFISGYTVQIAASSEAPDDRSYFLQKPFTPDVLAAKMREMLDAPSS
ncbi:MAG: response regulator [Sandaracinaceae bacterium]|nr:response regulator [Sandaracinaceae bacterium]